MVEVNHLDLESSESTKYHFHSGKFYPLIASEQYLFLSQWGEP